MQAEEGPNELPLDRFFGPPHHVSTPRHTRPVAPLLADHLGCGRHAGTLPYAGFLITAHGAIMTVTGRMFS